MITFKFITKNYEKPFEAFLEVSHDKWIIEVNGTTSWHYLENDLREELRLWGAKFISGVNYFNLPEFYKQEVQKEKKHSHYFKECPYDYIDVYRVIEMWGVNDPCLQHVIKKALCAGERGHKDIETDVQNMIDTLERWKEMQKEYRNTH